MTFLPPPARIMNKTEPFWHEQEAGRGTNAFSLILKRHSIRSMGSARAFGLPKRKGMVIYHNSCKQGPTTRVRNADGCGRLAGLVKCHLSPPTMRAGFTETEFTSPSLCHMALAIGTAQNVRREACGCNRLVIALWRGLSDLAEPRAQQGQLLSCTFPFLSPYNDKGPAWPSALPRPTGATGPRDSNAKEPLAWLNQCRFSQPFFLGPRPSSPFCVGFTFSKGPATDHGPPCPDIALTGRGMVLRHPSDSRVRRRL